MTAAKKRSGRGKWVVLALLVAGAAGGWWWYQKQPKEPPLDYKTAAIVRGDITQAVTANGQLSAVKNVTVGSQVSGIITDIRVDFNSHVTNGQVVAQIDSSTYLQTITQIEAELANSKAGLELAELNERRAKELRASELVSVSEYDRALVELHQAQAVVRMREATLNKAKVDLERTTIYAPIDGIVISRAVDVGQTVAASFNAPTLFNIVNDLRNMRIEAMVSEADVGGVSEGQRVSFTVDAFPGRPFRGEVTQVRFAPVTNQNVVNYTTVVEVNNADLKLRPGMTANASIITAERRDVLKVPNAALRFRPPEGAIVKGVTNAPAGGGERGTNRVRRAEGDSTGDGSRGGREFAGGEGGGRPNREEMRRRFENMTPEQREEMRSRMRNREGGSGAPRGAIEGPVNRTVYVIEKDSASGEEKTILKPVTIKTGIADASHTEVIEGLSEGDIVVSGLNITTPQPTTFGQQRGPVGSPFGGGGFRPR